MAGEPPLQAGPNKGKTVPIKEMMQLHWKLFGWDEQTGIPTLSTLIELRHGTIRAGESINGKQNTHFQL